MKNKILLSSILLGLLTILSISCEKENNDLSKKEDLFFPDGLTGTAILFNSDMIYKIPSGYALYITTCERLYNENANKEYYLTSFRTSEINKRKVIIIPSDTSINIKGFLNGLLIKNDVEVLNWYTESEYIVPEGKTLYLTSFQGFGLLIDNVELTPWVGSQLEVFSPLILPSGTKISHTEKFIFTGYLRNY